VDISAILYVFENNEYIHSYGYISMKHMLFVIILVAGIVPYASAAQLDGAILYQQESTEPSFQFLRIIYIEYPNGGDLSESLRGKNQIISFEADSDTPGMDELVTSLNKNLKEISSNAVVIDVKINYQAILQGNENSAVIEYKIQLIPTITNHVLTTGFEKTTVDANWRGISIDEPIVLQTAYGSFDVNNPKSALDIMIPEISENLKYVSIIEMPLIDASGILELPLYKWHSLFDNTAIIPGAVEYKYAGENVITHYSMGECSIDVGPCSDRQWIENINLDKKYTIRIIESRDDATISFEGYVDSTRLDGVEVFHTSLKSLVTQKPDTDEFPATVMYGMAGFAVIGGIVMFVMSDRKLKKDKNEGQTGVDPAHLVAYDTSSSSGGYKTNRGESHLVSNDESKMPL
jgi:hypothetical protein